MNFSQKLKMWGSVFVAFLVVVAVVAVLGKVIGSTIGLFSVFALVGVGGLVGLIASVPLNQMLKTTFTVKTYIVAGAVLVAMIVTSFDVVSPILKNSTNAGTALSIAAWSFLNLVIIAIFDVVVAYVALHLYRQKHPMQATMVAGWLVSILMFSLCGVMTAGLPTFFTMVAILAVMWGGIYGFFAYNKKS